MKDMTNASNAYEAEAITYEQLIVSYRQNKVGIMTILNFQWNDSYDKCLRGGSHHLWTADC